MNTSQKKQFADYGPYSHWNWRAQPEVDLPNSATEVQLFSDVSFKGIDVEHGPYLLMNAQSSSSIESRPLMHARLVLRCEHYLDPNQDPTIRPRNTDTSRYHGGGLADEIAALYSLCLGVRLKTGGIVRRFSQGNEYGRPRVPMPDEIPLFFPPHDGRYVLPWHRGERKLSELQERMSAYVLLKPQQAAVLVRAARLYQDAVWLAESDSEISWLLLVSAVEVAANHWYKEEWLPPDPRERLERLAPNLVQNLGALSNGGEAIAIVSEYLTELLKSTSKFLKFLNTFKPQQPPSERPIRCQIKWSKGSLDDIFNKVYSHRSKALHGGIPFPKPMCEPPSLDDESDIPVERPDVGLAVSTLGASWSAKDVPVHFHIFEYIVRHALLNWWHSMIQGA